MYPRHFDPITGSQKNIKINHLRVNKHHASQDSPTFFLAMGVVKANCHNRIQKHQFVCLRSRRARQEAFYIMEKLYTRTSNKSKKLQGYTNSNAIESGNFQHFCLYQSMHYAVFPPAIALWNKLLPWPRTRWRR
jgi:hypothetical protein